MKKWLLTASTDGNSIDFETIIEADTEPGYWECNEQANAHGCPFWSLDEMEEQKTW